MRKAGCRAIVGVFVSGLVLGQAHQAIAGEVKAQFNIPAGAAKTVLDQIDQKLHVEMIYNPVVVDDKRAHGVSGNLTISAALTEALAGSGLEFQVRPSGVVVITASAVTPAVAHVPAAIVPPVRESTADQPTEVIVTGIRAGALSAEAAKLSSDQISDFVFSEDVDKLPDGNTAEALQRLTGVQITREDGSGVGVQIRGMTEVLAELNGRPIFTAGINNEGTPSRNLNFEDLPSDLIASAEVVKTPTADQVEGGIGGSVNFATQHPLNLRKGTYGFSVRDIYSEGLPVHTPSFSAFAVDHWNSPIGPFGLWLSYSSERYAFRDDQEEGTAPNEMISAANVANGGAVTFPVGVSTADFAYYAYGTHARDNFNLSAEWQPTERLDVTFDYNRSINTARDNVEYSFADLALLDPSTKVYTFDYDTTPRLATTTDGTPYVAVAQTRTTAVFGSFIDDKRGVTSQTALAATYSANAWKVSAEAYYDRSAFDSLFDEVEATMQDVPLTYDFRGRIGQISYPDTDLMNLGNYTISKLNYAHQHDFGIDGAARFDIERRFSDFIQRVKFGGRFSERIAKFGGNNPVFTLNASALDYAGLYQPTRFNDLLGGAGLQSWMVPDPDALRSVGTTFSTFGAGAIPGPDPRQAFSIKELATTGYVRFDYQTNFFAWPVDGNFGVRMVRTRVMAIGPKVDAATGAIEGGASQKSSNTEALPSFNLRLKLRPKLQVRLAASKVVARPEFSLLNPALFIQNNFLTATAGNPNLRPLRADQFDASVEYYFSKQGYVSASSFYKSVIDFPEMLIAPEVIDGQTFQVSRPQNAAQGWIKGNEFSYQQFYEGLPDGLKGLGLIVNATFINSAAPDGYGGIGRLPLMSKETYNVIGMYERKRISVRIAYNWRSGYPTSYAVFNNRRYANIQCAYGQIDAGFSYHVDPHLTLTLDAANLQNATLYQSFAGVNYGALRYERRWTVGFRYRN